MSKGRCAIYDKIDSLDEARTVAELAARLKPILNQLAYFAITGEGSVQDTHEEWHEEFTDNLYSATSSDHREAQLNNVRMPAEAAPTVQRRHQNAPKASGKASTQMRTVATHTVAMPAPPPGNRPRPGDIPASLLAIMQGTHPSLREPDD